MCRRVVRRISRTAACAPGRVRIVARVHPSSAHFCWHRRGNPPWRVRPNYAGSCGDLADPPLEPSDPLPDSSYTRPSQYRSRRGVYTGASRPRPSDVMSRRRAVVRASGTRRWGGACAACAGLWDVCGRKGGGWGAGEGALRCDPSVAGPSQHVPRCGGGECGGGRPRGQMSCTATWVDLHACVA